MELEIIAVLWLQLPLGLLLFPKMGSHSAAAPLRNKAPGTFTAATTYQRIQSVLKVHLDSSHARVRSESRRVRARSAPWGGKGARRPEPPRVRRHQRPPIDNLDMDETGTVP